VQVDPIKPMLKAPGTKRLKLTHYELLSSFAFRINLRRYTEEAAVEIAKKLAQARDTADEIETTRVKYLPAVAYTRPLFSSA